MDIGQSNWTEVDDNNNTAAPDGMPEGMLPSGVNNWARAAAGAIKRWFNWTIPKATTAGTPPAYVLTYGVAPTGLVDGMIHNVQFHATNAALATLNVNALGDKPLYSWQAGAWAQVTAGVIQPNQISRVSYNVASGAYRLLDISESTTFIMTGSFDSSGLAGPTVDFQNVPAGINHLAIKFQGNSSGPADVVVQFYDSSGSLDNGPTSYEWAASSNSSTAGAPGSAGSASADSITIVGAANSATTGWSATMELEDIQAATYTKVEYKSSYSDGANFISVSGAGAHKIAGRITGVRILSRASAGGSPTAAFGKATLIGRV